MNLPSGKSVKTNLDAASTDLVALLDELRRKRFNGYLAIAIKGQAGVEEGTVLIDTGKIVGTTYEYYAFNKEVAGEPAFRRILNAAACPNGVIDVVELSAEQVHLALAFHEDAVFVPSDESLRHLKLPAYSPFYEDEIRQQLQNPAADPVKTYKMFGLSRKAASEATMPEGQEP